tara:strand:- start:176 stop:397 length:222 start_codon:yes stop_codon:yes gene_type:complete
VDQVVVVREYVALMQEVQEMRVAFQFQKETLVEQVMLLQVVHVLLLEVVVEQLLLVEMVMDQKQVEQEHQIQF